MSKATLLFMLAFLIGIWQLTLRRMWERFSPQKKADLAWLVHTFNLAMYLLGAVVAAQVLKFLLGIAFTGDVLLLTAVLFVGILIFYKKINS